MVVGFEGVPEGRSGWLRILGMGLGLSHDTPGAFCSSLSGRSGTPRNETNLQHNHELWLLCVTH